MEMLEKKKFCSPQVAITQMPVSRPICASKTPIPWYMDTEEYSGGSEYGDGLFD